MCEELSRLRSIAANEDLTPWREALPTASKEGVDYLLELSVSELRRACRAGDLFELNAKVAPLVAKAAEDAATLPPNVHTLIEEQNQARVLLDSLNATVQRAAIDRADALISLIKRLETGVREEIATRAREIFRSISADIQRYWKFLQPNDKITDVRLVVPGDNEKAVEVALRFHGREQDSPRLTLSEGQRNALGLCIFLAMASKAGDEDRPIVLDDVVISFDREHRSRVGILLQTYFSARQIILFTHDREWYFELQRLLTPKDWSFHRLRPYATPAVGIAFADHGMDIASAKARAKTEPEEALGNIRRIMDVALSEIAERIGLLLPHLRGDENDHRTAGQFLVALERAATRSFKKKSGEVYVQNAEALSAIKKTKPQLALWGNRGTHTFSGSTTEAEELIEGCEAVISAFTCESCRMPLGDYEAKGGKVECRCGALQWRPE